MPAFILLCLASLFLTGSELPLLSEDSRVRLTPFEGTDGIHEAQALLDQDQVDLILKDHESKVPADFRMTPYFEPFVRFWFGIYTRYTSDHIIIHDRDNLDIVYSVIDFSHVAKKLNRFERSAIVQTLSKEKSQEIAQTLRELSRGDSHSRLSLSVLKVLQAHGGSLPMDPSARSKELLRRANNLRTQTGQRNLIAKGVERMLPFDGFFADYFREFNLPEQLIAIPFLESSFNTKAESKVGALGIWQFMPLIASYFMPRRSPWLDYRNNPFISSIAAMHLLKENKKILGSWDMAVTAYNSGTKHLVLARRKHGARTLQDVFEKYEHKHHGFASKNFYAEFLALVHALAYRDEIFKTKSPALKTNVTFAISKCSFLPSDLLKKNLISESTLQELNPHITNLKHLHPRGTILVTNDTLPGRIFRRVSRREAVALRPLDWTPKLLRNQSCSTR